MARVDTLLGEMTIMERDLRDVQLSKQEKADLRFRMRRYGPLDTTMWLMNNDETVLEPYVEESHALVKKLFVTAFGEDAYKGIVK